jgi:hypothetical protein
MDIERYYLKLSKGTHLMPGLDVIHETMLLSVPSLGLNADTSFHTPSAFATITSNQLSVGDWHSQ